MEFLIFRIDDHREKIAYICLRGFSTSISRDEKYFASSLHRKGNSNYNNFK